MTGVCLRLFGSPELCNAKTDQNVRFPYVKLILLLAYLALENRVHTREALADLFWPELIAEDARANLRRALFNLQKVFAEAGMPKSLIQADRNAVRLSRECVWVDVLEFEGRSPRSCMTAINQQLTLYKGTFLDGVFPADAELASWVQNRRIQYEQEMVSLLEQAVDINAAAGDFDAMERSCRQLIAKDGVNELAHLSLISMHMDSGHEIAALKIYDVYRKNLQAQMGVYPSPQLSALVSVLLSNRQIHIPSANWSRGAELMHHHRYETR
jgi:DNA-binding SARP family transcriptional activator